MEALGFLLFIVAVVVAFKDKTGFSWGEVFMAIKILAIVAVFYLIAGFLGLG